MGIFISHASGGLCTPFSTKIKQVLTLSFFLIGFTEPLQAATPVPASNALPTNGQVVAGNASMNSSSTANSAVMNINQTSQRAVINWDSFNVGKNATVNFNQPNANAVTLNRVTGATASMINGAINANGQVILVNSNGVVFGKGAEVNAAAVTASTLNIANQEFMDGKSAFKDDGTGVGSKAGKIINKGAIRTNQTDPSNTEGGFIALLAPEVRNQGVLLAQKGGTVAIGSGNQITLTIQGQSLIAIKVDEAAYNGLISNKHIIEAPGGLVVLATSAANQLMAGIIKNTGRISANSMVNNGGTIELVAKNITQSGQVASNSQTGQGGQINIVGNEIAVAKNSSTTATGATAGGQVNIGLANTQVTGGTQVNSQSSNQITSQNQSIIKANADLASTKGQLANTVTIEENALIDTSATLTGNGGAIAIWSQVQTTVAGILKSMGGALSGNGGFIETSSKGAVSLAPTVQINTSANNQTGKSGTWLLDPIDLTIDSATANLISQILTNNNVTIAVTNSTTACPIGSCTQNGAGSNSSLTIVSGADILKAGSNYTTLTLSSSGIFNLNANISGQNLDVIIQSSIAYLNVGSSINASKVTVQAQTIYAQGSIQTSNYLINSSPGSLGNAIQLLAQAIYVSGRLSANTSQGVAGSIKLEANTITLQAGAVLEANGDEGGQITVAANDASFTSATIQANGGNGRGGTLSIAAANDQYFNNATVLANGTTDGGAITITTASGDIYFTNSLIQTNGSSGRGGSIGLSATNSTVIANSTIAANGYSQGGFIKIGNDATNGSLPFSIVTSIDEQTTITAAQLDPNTANQHGGFIETSGHTLNLLASINAGRGGMWLLDPSDFTIASSGGISGAALSAFLQSGNVTIDTTSSPPSCSGALCALMLAGTGFINVDESISWNSTSTLTLRASKGITGSGDISMSGLGALVIQQTSTTTYSGVISGNGSLTLQGSGTLNLANINTYTGPTNIALGARLALLGSGSIANSSSVNIDGTFDISQINQLTSATTIFIGGLNDYIGGSGFVFLGRNNLVVTNASGSFSGVISDGGLAASLAGGSLTIAGGSQTLSGSNTYTGITNIAQGATLYIVGIGSIANSASINVDGTLDISGAGVSNNLLTNGGFELSYVDQQHPLGWLFSGDPSYTGINVGDGVTRTGNNRFAFGSNGGISYLTQTLSTQVGARYIVSFWGRNVASGTYFDLNFGSHNLLSLVNVSTADTAYVKYSFNVVASGTSTTLTLSGLNVPSYFDVDDVSVRSVGIIGGLGNYFKSLTGSITGQINLGSNTLNLLSTSGVFRGVIAEGSSGLSGGGLNIVSGRETLTSLNTYSGPTTINSGATLVLAGNGSIANSSTIDLSGTLDVQNGATPNSIMVSGSGVVTNSAAIVIPVVPSVASTPPPPPPPPVVFSQPLPDPSPARLEIASTLVPIVAPAPPVPANSPPPATVGGEVSMPAPARAAPLMAMADGSIQLTPPPPPGAAPAPANASTSQAPPAAPPPASNRASSAKEAREARNGSNNSEARKNGGVKDGVEKAEAKDRSSKPANGPSKYVSKYANGFKNADKSAPKAVAAKALAANKPSANREGKYESRLRAMNNNPAVATARNQNPFAGIISPFPIGVPHADVTPLVLRGGDSLAQSYDDVPSIRNSGVANVARSRNSENFHQSLESVNLMSTLNLFIIH